MENYNKGEKHKEVDESAWKNMKRGEREKKNCRWMKEHLADKDDGH